MTNRSDAAAGYVSGLLSGLLVASFGCFLYFTQNNEPVQYTITAEQRCLTDDGITFNLTYKGYGVARFTVLPPNPGNEPEKESQ